jgi:tetratricopeptide (TPR) repeat protein
MQLSLIISRWLALYRAVAGWGRIGSKKPKNAPTIIFSLADGRKLTAGELQGVSGRVAFRDGKLLDVIGGVRYEIIGKRAVPAVAESLHQQARGAGGRGDYKQAIALLERASELAPEWPYPVYDRAYTHLLMRDFESARTYYRRTLELSPRGFFTAITALDTLTREQNQELPVGTYLAYVSLEWMDDAAKKDETVRELVKMIPQFAPAWKLFAGLCEDDGERLTAIENGLAAQPDAETKGMLEINKALVLNLKGTTPPQCGCSGSWPSIPSRRSGQSIQQRPH